MEMNFIFYSFNIHHVLELYRKLLILVLYFIFSSVLDHS